MDQLLGSEKIYQEHLQLKINGIVLNEGSILAKHYNDYFLDSLLDLAETFSEVNCCRDDHGDGNASYCRLQSIDEDNIFKIIANLKNSKAKDIFGLDTSFLKEHKITLTPVLTIAVNQSINENNFPLALKKAVVKPIFKSGDKLCVSNYQPISILPAISKIFEKVVAEQQVEHLDHTDALHPCQFGFRKRYSTESACCYLLEDIKPSLDGGGVVGAVFLDLRKAFDTVNHQLLISKLSDFSLDTNTIAWI